MRPSQNYFGHLCDVTRILLFVIVDERLPVANDAASSSHGGQPPVAQSSPVSAETPAETSRSSPQTAHASPNNGVVQKPGILYEEISNFQAAFTPDPPTLPKIVATAAGSKDTIQSIVQNNTLSSPAVSRPADILYEEMEQFQATPTAAVPKSVTSPDRSQVTAEPQKKDGPDPDIMTNQPSSSNITYAEIPLSHQPVNMTSQSLSYSSPSSSKSPVESSSKTVPTSPLQQSITAVDVKNLDEAETSKPSPPAVVNSTDQHGQTETVRVSFH